MRIGIDAHVVGRGKGGAETYCLNLISGLRGLDGDDAYTVFVSPEGADLAERLPAPNFSYEVVDAASLVTQRFVHLPRRSDQLGLDVLHVQRVVPPFVRAARVVTIHDVAHTLRPDLFDSGEGFALRRLIAMSARRAEHIITDSEASRRDIVGLFGVPAERISAIPLGVDHATSPSRVLSLEELGERHGVRAPYLLYVGAVETRKNLPCLLDAFARLAANGAAASTLVIAGPIRTARLEDELAARCRGLGVEDRVVFTGHVDTETLASLYVHAHAFAFPSLLEGFGLPPLEALAHGLPVAVSDIPVHREMLGEAAVYFDPTSADALSAALRTVMSDEAVRRALSSRGPGWARRYTWRRTAERTLAAYREAADTAARSGASAGRRSP